ncbi:MAG: hypothetical protein IPM27_02700 [Nitrosomonadales bacterium]|nr:hypothetical protein [Nitrosomonadales bacterium]
MNECHWLLPEDLLQKSIDVMRPHGAIGNEGLALWLGKATGAEIQVTHIIEVTGPGFSTSPLHMRLSMRAMSKLTDLSEQLDRYLVGQIHSHPRTFTDLSQLDVNQGIRVPNYLSVVCPHYAQRPGTTLGECGIHVFEGREYIKMNRVAAERRIKVTASRATKLICEVPA